MYAPNLGTLFLATASEHEAESALVFDNRRMSYGELAALALELASKLEILGLKERDVIVISGEKTPTTFGLIQACLLSGAPYVMLDPDNPAERQARILDRCEPRFLYVGHGEQAAGLGGIAIERGVEVLTPERLNAVSPARFEPRSISGNTPAYIMFTSGSTGFPKGAVISHANVARLIAWSRDRFGFGSGEILTNVNPLYFDNSVFDIYSSLFTGAALAPFTKDETLNPATLLKGIEARQCTSWFSVPSFLMYLDSMRALRPDAMPHIRRFIFGGEGYPLARLQSLYDKFANRAEIVNVYGPTECTCICSAYTVTQADFTDLQGFPPLGALTPEFTGLVVDDDGNAVAKGEIGELVLLGPCVGMGYFNDPERTAQAFGGRSLDGKYLDASYRTGDLVTVSATDGKIRIFGRKDNQIKHMGYRIELEEIENALCTIAGIHQAAALHGKRFGNSCLAAAVSADAGLAEKDVLDKLRMRVPAYMVPSEIHFRDTLPKNANGKLDRKLLKVEYFDEGE